MIGNCKADFCGHGIDKLYLGTVHLYLSQGARPDGRGHEIFYWFFWGHEIFRGFLRGHEIILENFRGYEIFPGNFRGHEIYSTINFWTKNCFLKRHFVWQFWCLWVYFGQAKTIKAHLVLNDNQCKFYTIYVGKSVASAK